MRGYYWDLSMRTKARIRKIREDRTTDTADTSAELSPPHDRHLPIFRHSKVWTLLTRLFADCLCLDDESCLQTCDKFRNDAGCQELDVCLLEQREPFHIKVLEMVTRDALKIIYLLIRWTCFMFALITLKIMDHIRRFIPYIDFCFYVV